MGTKEQIEEPVHSIKQRISDDKSLHRVHSSNNREVDKLAREERDMDFSSAVQWWEEWQLRILVLSSLAIQFYLAWFARGRKYLIGPVYRFSIWLSYLGADAVAIYALATLFNRQRKAKCSSSADVDLADIGRRTIEVLWTPILLMHLGGQVTISAYNIEDNELWTRHVVTAVSQVRTSQLKFSRTH
jgi:hypothetical protein